MDKQLDPKGLVQDAYQIEGIDLPECRSILLDWALSVPEGAQMQALIQGLLQQYQAQHPDHPMTSVLIEGATKPPLPARRGGAAARRRSVN